MKISFIFRSYVGGASLETIFKESMIKLGV